MRKVLLTHSGFGLSLSVRRNFDSSTCTSLNFLLYRCHPAFHCLLWFCKILIRFRIFWLIGPVCSLATRVCSNSIRDISYSFPTWARVSSSWMISVLSLFWHCNSSLCHTAEEMQAFASIRIQLPVELDSQRNPVCSSRHIGKNLSVTFIHVMTMRWCNSLKNRLQLLSNRIRAVEIMSDYNLLTP